VETGGLRTIRSDWDRTLLVCAKCSKKLGGGFGHKGREPLGKALRRHLGLKKGRKARMGIVEVKCLGVCPKNAVTVVDTRDGHRWRLVHAGATIEAIVTGLDLDESAPVQPEADTQDR
jgi:predicted metal-binding protein